MTRCCTASSPSPRSARCGRRRPPTRRSRAGNTAARCTAFRGARRTCSPFSGYKTTWGAGRTGAGHRPGRDRRAASRRGGRGARREAHARRAGAGRRVVRRDDEQSMEARSGLERLLGRSRSATAAGLVGFAIGSETLGSISSPSTRMRRHRAAADVRPRSAHRRDGALLDDGQARPDLPQRRGLRARPRRDARTRWRGLARRSPPLSLGRDCAAEVVSRRLLEEPFDLAETGSQGRSARCTRRSSSTTPRWRCFAGSASSSFRWSSPTCRTMRCAWSYRGGGGGVRRADALGTATKSSSAGEVDWANTFRAARFIPAVDYINANRCGRSRWSVARALQVGRRDRDADRRATAQLTATNLTGHPAVILPNGFRDDGTPVSLTFLGPLFGEAGCSLSRAHISARPISTRRRRRHSRDTVVPFWYHGGSRSITSAPAPLRHVRWHPRPRRSGAERRV